MSFRQQPSLMTVYERLRKQSYRQRVEPLTWVWGFVDPRLPSARAHRHYLDGVRDALDAVADDVN